MSEMLREVLSSLIERHGALVEKKDDTVLEYIAPKELCKILNLPECGRLSFSSSHDRESIRVMLDINWVERITKLIGDRGRWNSVQVSVKEREPSHPEDILDRSIVLSNATFRFIELKPALTRYWIFTLYCSALSDEKFDSLIEVGVNLSNASSIDSFSSSLVERVSFLEAKEESFIQSKEAFPDRWQNKAIEAYLHRILRVYVQSNINPFIERMKRIQEKDYRRLVTYHRDLLKESFEKLSAQKNKEQATPQGKILQQRELMRQEAIISDYKTKINDLIQKFAITVDFKFIQCLEINMPVYRFQILIKRRKNERMLHLDWNPLVKKLDPLPCDAGYTQESLRVVCDESLHLVDPLINVPCRSCSKISCRACFPHACPTCKKAW